MTHDTLEFFCFSKPETTQNVHLHNVLVSLLASLECHRKEIKKKTFNGGFYCVAWKNLEFHSDA